MPGRRDTIPPAVTRWLHQAGWELDPQPLCHVPVDDDAIRNATRAYYGLVTFVDEQVGRILDAADRAGQLDDTLVVYTSDHGEMLGAHGLWKKSTMYEEAVGVPLILAGSGVPRGRVCQTNASLVDVFPTVVQATGASFTDDDGTLPGRSLRELANTGFGDRDVFVEYHDGWSQNAIYMLRDATHKYVHYTHDRPQLFDMVNDPWETRDLAGVPEVADDQRRMREKLFAVVDLDAVDARAKAEQELRIEQSGGRAQLLNRGDDFRYTPAPAQYDPADQRRHLHPTGAASQRPADAVPATEVIR